MRNISSITSHSRVTSVRYDGKQSASASPSLRSIWISNAARIVRTAASGISVPIKSFIRLRRSTQCRSGKEAIPKSIGLPSTCAPQQERNRSTVRRSALSHASGAKPRSKRNEASVEIPCRRAALRIAVALKLAHSTNTRVVLSVTSASVPPSTPAIQSTRLAVSHIIISLPPALRSTPSNVVKGVPSGIWHSVRLFPSILSASNM